MASNPSIGRKLSALLAQTSAGVAPDIEITDLTLDSREVSAGAAFVALPGLRTHGIGFATQAVAAGARVILWQPADNVAAPPLPADVPLIAMPNLSVELGTIADRFFGAPSQQVRVAGITGTNGKTTTAYVLAAALEQLGMPAAYAGTLGAGRIGAIAAGTHTTPDCITLHRQLARWRDAAVRQAAIEVSSHALEQQRVAGVRFDTAVFTNLTRDHLDYHGTLAAYGAAKAQLFAWPHLRHAVINVDDAFGVELARRDLGAAQLIACSARADMGGAFRARSLWAERVIASPNGLDIHVNGSWGPAVLSSRFIGAFNVDNLLAVLGVLLGWDIPLARAVAALAQCAPPPGRMETLSHPGRPLAIVDYAHTPDALEKALSAVRAHCTGRIVCVFGCGGDRDPGKRPLMGAVAERLADEIVVTDDNPRTEDGDAIVTAILDGLREPRRATVERDRARAIATAIAGAAPSDVVLIAGKGHEDYQIVGTERRQFSDRAVALAALSAEESRT